MKTVGEPVSAWPWRLHVWFRPQLQGARHAYRGRLLQSKAAAQIRLWHTIAGLSVCVIYFGLWLLAWQPLEATDDVTQFASASSRAERSAVTLPSAPSAATATPAHASALAGVLDHPSLFLWPTVSTALNSPATPQQSESWYSLGQSGQVVAPLPASPASTTVQTMAEHQSEAVRHWQIQIVPLSAQRQQQHQLGMQRGLQAEQAGAWALAQAAYRTVLEHDAHAVDAMAGLCRIAQQQSDHAAIAACLQQLQLELPNLSADALSMVQQPSMAADSATASSRSQPSIPLTDLHPLDRSP